MEDTRWLDPHVGANAWETLLRQLARGPSRVLLWGPAGVGRSTLLSRLAEERTDVVVLDTRSTAEARAALVEAPRDRPVVIASRARIGLEADAYVECRTLPIDDGTPGSALAFLERLVARDGTPPGASQQSSLRTIAHHTEGLPGSARRASELLRLMSADALAARCAEASDALVVHGRRVDHPLATDHDDDAEGMDDASFTAAVVLLAAGEPIAPSLAERWLPDAGLDALLALRDRGALSVTEDGRVAARASLARSIARRPDFRDTFRSVAATIDDATVRQADAAREGWIARGDEGALAEIGAREGRLRRAAERALASLDDPEAADRLARSVLALCARSEVLEGPRADDELLRRACDALGAAPRSHGLLLEHARRLRLAGRFEALERELERLDPSRLPPALAIRWHIERAHTHRYRRDLEAAELELEKASACRDASARPHDDARLALELGGLRYWQQRFEDAVSLFARARTLAARLGAARSEAIALSNMCLCHTMIGDEAAATEHGAAAVALFERLGDSGALGTTLGHLGTLAYQYGRLDDAERFLADAEARVEQAGYFEQRVHARFNRACVALAAGDIAEAQSRLRSLPRLLAANPSPYVSVHLGRLESDVYEREGRYAEARAALERGLAEASGSSEALAQLGAQLARVLARMGETDASRRAAARAAEALADTARADLRAPCELVLDHAARLREEPAEDPWRRLASALRPVWEGRSTRARIGVSAMDSGAVRAAAAMYWADLDPASRVTVEWAARDPDAAGLCLDDRGERGRLPGGDVLEATARRNAHRLLRLLAEAGSRGCAREDLIEAMWPGEQILGDAALNRLHNALAQLRAAGLSTHLVRADDRYRLEGLRVVFAGRDDPFARSDRA